MNKTLKKITVAALLVTVAFVSVFCLGPFFSSDGSYEHCIGSIDSNINTVMKLTAASTVTSLGVSALPDDTATPIADKLADFSEYFLFILCVLYAEKYMLTVIGGAVFYILIPLACVGLAVSQFVWPDFLRRTAGKLVVFAIVILLTVPASIWVGDKIHETYRDNIDRTIYAAEQFGEEASDYSEAKEQNAVQSFFTAVTDTSKELLNTASNILNNFIEAIAVMIVTSCVIPVFVLIFFIWLIKLITGVQLNVPVYPRKRKIRTKI